MSDPGRICRKIGGWIWYGPPSDGWPKGELDDWPSGAAGPAMGAVLSWAKVTPVGKNVSKINAAVTNRITPLFAANGRTLENALIQPPPNSHMSSLDLRHLASAGNLPESTGSVNLEFAGNALRLRNTYIT